MTEHAVVIAGGGPTGTMLAAELTLAGVDVVVVERRAGHDLDDSRAGGLAARTIEVLDQRGVAERFLAEGEALQIHTFAGVRLDLGDVPTRHGYGLALWQRDFERILGAWVAELGVPIIHETEVTGFAPDETGVDVALSDGRTLRARYLVGCDGGRSVVRKTAGIDFPGLEATTSWLVAEADTDTEPTLGLHPEGGGIGPVDRFGGSTDGPYRMVLKELQVGVGEATEQDVRDTLHTRYGTDFGMRTPTWVSRFSDATRQAASYRRGRVLIAGDAAHIHPPQGGQGLNTGVQDAVNLGWKLAQVVSGTSPDSLLDTYQAERHPVGARVQRLSKSFVALGEPDDRHEALTATVAELLDFAEPRRHLAAMLSGLDIRYDLGEGHPLVGRRMPDLDLHTADGPTRLFALLHAARPVLLDLGGPGAPDLAPWADRVRRVEASSEGGWELPVIGEVPASAAVLIRPDGHVAWAGELTDPELPQVLSTWFGAPAA
jgi:3-(3-hydroxy-phenyl)propionate hydroxylase